MTWTKFEKRIGVARVPAPPFVNISNMGYISFSVRCVKEYHISEYKYAVLYYDTDGRKIGIEFTNDSSGLGVRRLRKRVSRNNNSGLQLSGLGMLNYYGVKPEVSTRYTPSKEGNLLVISLEEDA